MSKVIDLKSFRLEEIDITKQEHLNLIMEFDKDALIKKYLFPYKSSFYDMVSENDCGYKIFNTFYAIYFSSKPIGYVEIKSKDNTYLNYALLKEERKKGYATMFLKELSEYLLNNYEEVNSVNAIIRKSNVDSINVVKKAGLIKVEDKNDFETYKKSR